MTAPEFSRQDKPEFATATDLLASVSVRYNELEVGALEGLFEQMSYETYCKLIRERAALIADLPTMLTDYALGGGSVPQQAEDFAASFAPLAEQYLKDDDLDKMSRLLTPEGMSIQDPNVLERLLAYLQQSPAEAP